MNRWLKLLVTFSLCLLIFNYSFSKIETERLEDVYLQIRAEKLYNDFYMIKYDVDEDKIYIGLNSFFYFLELYSLEVDLIEERVIGKIGNKNIKIKFNKENYFIENEEMYVESSALIKELNLKYIRLDLSVLTLDVKANFLLPYEEKEKSRLERLRLDGIKEEEIDKYDIVMEDRFFQPGLLKLTYDTDEIRENDYYFSYEYGTQLLWGDFYLSGSLKPESEINSGTLTYRDVFQDNDLELGSIGLIAPNFISVDTNLLGVSFDSYDTYSQNDNGEVIIKGEAQGVDSIELYRNSILIDYKVPKDKDFEFRVTDGIMSSVYVLKIYYKDGKIEERTVYSLGDMDALKKGKSKFVLQGGKTEKDGVPQGMGKIYYGFTDKLTLGTGFYSLTDLKDRNFEIFEGNFIYNTRLERFPTLINYSYFYETNEKESSYNLNINQKIYDYDLRFSQEKYSKYIYVDSGMKEYNSISLFKAFDYNSFEFGFSKNIYIEDNEDFESKSIIGGWSTSYLNPIAISLKVSYDIEGDKKGVTYFPSLSYSRGVSLILDGEIKRDNLEEYEKYTFKINKRQMEIVENSLYGDMGVQGTYSTKDDTFVYGLSFSLDLESFFNMRAHTIYDIDADKNRTRRSGLEVTKVIDLSNPLKSVNNEISVNNYLIKGRVFLDKNGNGVFDKGDTPLKNAAVIVDNRKFFSNEKGEYIATGNSNGEILEIDIDRNSIDPMMKNSKGKLRVKTKKSANLKLDIPIEVVSMITGNIWNSEAYTEREFVQNISMTSIQLEKDGKIYKEIDPEFDGLFFFEDVPPGKYNVKFIYYGQENVNFSPETLEVDVKLTNPEEGEYFDGRDTVMIKETIEETKEKIQSVDTNIEENIDEDYLDDIINNY